MRIPKTPRVVAAAVAFTALAAQPGLARWADWPPGPTDAQLEQIVRVAYTAAVAVARKDTNYFARDGVTDPLRSAIEDELGRQGLAFVNVAEKPVADLTAAMMCTKEGTELRFSVNMFGDSISLAATTDERVFSYHYDPHEDAAIVVAPAQACTKK
jgi:hypothetical protein